MKRSSAVPFSLSFDVEERREGRRKRLPTVLPLFPWPWCHCALFHFSDYPSGESRGTAVFLRYLSFSLSFLLHSSSRPLQRLVTPPRAVQSCRSSRGRSSMVDKEGSTQERARKRPFSPPLSSSYRRYTSPAVVVLLQSPLRVPLHILPSFRRRKKEKPTRKRPRKSLCANSTQTGRKEVQTQ